jgi:hypothetical protein
MIQLSSGAMAMAFGVAALFFLRFWRDTRDRLFGLFAMALFVLAINRVALALSAVEAGRDHYYWVRLCAFVLILAAIIDKNRNPRPPRG